MVSTANVIIFAFLRFLLFLPEVFFPEVFFPEVFVPLVDLLSELLVPLVFLVVEVLFFVSGSLLMFDSFLAVSMHFY